MIHEDRVRQMIKLAVYDENKSMGEKKPAQYFRKDYLAFAKSKKIVQRKSGRHSANILVTSQETL